MANSEPKELTVAWWKIGEYSCEVALGLPVRDGPTFRMWAPMGEDCGVVVVEKPFKEVFSGMEDAVESLSKVMEYREKPVKELRTLVEKGELSSGKLACMESILVAEMRCARRSAAIWILAGIATAYAVIQIWWFFGT